MNLVPTSKIIQWAALAALVVECTGLAVAVDLYETGFDSFTVGPDQLAGTDSWTGTNVGEGVHGIDDGLVDGLGKTAFLGFTSPSTNFVSVAHPMSYDPVSAGTPTVEFFCLVGLSDSTNNQYDRFYISFYNGNDDLLGAVGLDNTPEDFGVLRHNGSELVHTGELFVNDTVQALFVSIDFSTNKWSAKLDGLPLFTNESFNTNNVDLDLGSIAAEWEIIDAGNPGNNWLLFDEWTVTAKGDTQNPVISGMPANLTVPTDPGQPTAVVSWQEPTSTDNVGVDNLVSTHKSGAKFPIGETVVTYTASDAAGNSASATFRITVEDSELPTITGTPGDLSFSVSPDEIPKLVSWNEPTAADNVAVTEFHSDREPGDGFSEGITVVTYTAQDAAGNTQTVSFKITIEISAGNPNPYEVWLERHFKTLLVDALADADDDGLSNIFEFGIGTNPLTSGGIEGFEAAPKMSKSAGELSYDFVTSSSLPQNVLLEVLQSSSLTAQNWEVIAARQGNSLWSGSAVDSGKLQVVSSESGKTIIQVAARTGEASIVQFFQLRVTVSTE